MRLDVGFVKLNSVCLIQDFFFILDRSQMLDAIFLVRCLICSDHVKLLSTYTPKIYSFVIIVRGSLLELRSRLS